MRNLKQFSCGVKVHGYTEWSMCNNQLDFLEQRAALLAKRHIEGTSRGDDTSYDVRELAMAHADLTFWRSLQSMVKKAPKQHQETIEALANAVRFPSSSVDIKRSLTSKVFSHYNDRWPGGVRW